MKVLFAMLLSLAVVGSAATSVSAQDVRIGVINLQRALNESNSGKKAKARFKEQIDRIQSDLERKKNEVDGLKDQLAKKALVMKEEERRNLEKEYQQKLREFERAYEDSQGELQLKDAELTRDLVKELQIVIQDYGRRGGYTVILEQAGRWLLYGARRHRHHRRDHRRVQSEVLIRDGAGVGPSHSSHRDRRQGRGDRPDVEVGPYAVVGDRVRIGARTVIGRTCGHEGRTTIGEDNVIFHLASVGAAPQDLKFHGEPSELTIGDRNQIREFCTLHLGTEAGGMVTRVGRRQPAR